MNMFRRKLILPVLLLPLLIVTSALGQTRVPTPESSLTFSVGADFKLATYEESLDYFRALDAASDYLQLIEIGKTSEGRPWYMALVSTPENLRQVERHRETAQRLAHPEGLDDAEARRLAQTGVAFVHIDGGLHASEVAGAQHTIQLAYDLVGHTNDPQIREILDNTVVLLWPSLNPDGQDIVVDWYRENVGTPYEVAPLNQLYQRFVGHDNNRDAYMLNMLESRVVTRTWRHWEPQIIYVHHQTAPFPTRIWLPPFAEPIGVQAPPLMSRTVNMIGMAIAHGLESNGQVGATHMGTGYDAWYPGYIDYMPMFQNIASFWTETALYRYATPHFYTINDFPPDQRDLRPKSLYSSPWPGGWWRLRDAVDYMRTASLSVLTYAAKYKETLLYNRYQSGRDVIQKYRSRPPYAYFVPQEQHDPVAPAELLKRLAFNGIRIFQLSEDVSHEGLAYPAGTWVVPMDQEFGELVRELLDEQEYPDLREFPDGPLEQPYDAAGWSLPHQMGVRVIPATQPLEENVRNAMTPVGGEPDSWSSGDEEPHGYDTHAVAAGIVPLPGRTTGDGDRLVVDPRQNNAFVAVGRALEAGAEVRFQASEEGGRYVISGVDLASQQTWVEELSLQATRTADGSGASTRARIGLYRPWQASMDEGWTRWLLEGYELPYSNLRNAEVRAGRLRDRYDVIILAADGPGTILDGFARGTVPEQFEGGLGTAGVRALDDFVRAGGTVVCFNQSSDFAIQQFNLPVRNVVADLERGDFFVSGSILQVAVDRSHPIMAGMPEQAEVFADRSPVFSTEDGFEGSALARYAEQGSPLVSGYLLGEEYLQGYAAALDVHHGDGHVILIGFRPQWRGQPFGTFRMVFNAALYGGELSASVTGNPDFWTAPEEGPDEEADSGNATEQR